MPRGEPEERQRPAGTLLRGTAIRETAARLLAERPDAAGPIHYRRWYELVQAAGFEIAGKDPPAVFLTQVSRSPVVAKTLDAGVYELDRSAPARLRREIANLQDELRRLTDASERASPGAAENAARPSSSRSGDRSAAWRRPCGRSVTPSATRR